MTNGCCTLIFPQELLNRDGRPMEPLFFLRVFDVSRQINDDFFGQLDLFYKSLGLIDAKQTMIRPQTP